MTDISVITAVYNRAATIGRAMDSLAEQTHPAEHVVIDGASTDGTLDIVRDRAGAGDTVISEPDNGIYDALNKGIAAAKGDVIGLLHSDDLFASPTVLARIAEMFDADADLDAVYADAAFFRPEAPDRIIRRYRSARFSPARIGWGLMPAHTTLYLRRRVFDHHGLYRTDYRIAADYEFIARIFKDGTLKARYEPDVWVKMQTGGISTGGLRSTIQINREVLRACRSNGIKINWFKLLSKYPAKIAEFLRPT